MDDMDFELNFLILQEFYKNFTRKGVHRLAK